MKRDGTSWLGGGDCRCCCSLVFATAIVVVLGLLAPFDFVLWLWQICSFMGRRPLFSAGLLDKIAPFVVVISHEFNICGRFVGAISLQQRASVRPGPESSSRGGIAQLN